MKRIRIVFALLAATVLVPFGLLVQHALNSMRTERALRHQVVAERAFDEMERELSAFLRREEERPFEDYGYVYVAGDGPTLVMERSPLFEPPQEDFVVGYFQVHPDGTVTSPSRAEGEPEDEAARRVLELVRRRWETAGEPNRRAVTKQSPGTTVNLSPEPGDRFADRSTSRQAREEGAAAYDSQTALGGLNRGAAERRQRATKVTQSMVSNVHAPTDPAEAVDVALEPMVGRLADTDHLLLYRTVLVEQNAYRQGLVLHIPSLVAWLSERVLAGSALAPYARIALSMEVLEPYPEDNEVYSFRHQFAEPFALVASVMTLAPLKESDGSAYFSWLSALLVLVTGVGLVAVYRMVAVTVSYAHRRYNFVSSVSHELKTPLTAIRMYGEMLRDGLVASAEKRQHYYGVITAETERLTRLVNNVLELARLEKKKSSPAVVVGDVRPIVEEIVAVLGPHAQKEGFHLQVEVEPELPPVRHDRDGLVQVLFNLVDNAIKYSREAKRKEVILACRRRAGDGVILSVTDRGPGVPPRHLNRIFDLFYRGEEELTRRSTGTGIGLALVRSLVERMGGSVSGRNADSGGFIVCVSLRSAPQ